MRVFISRLSALGDLVCSLPAAVAIKRTWPDSEIVWAADRRFSGAAACCGSIDRVIEWPKNLREALALARSLGEFDAALDLQGLMKSALPTAMVKAKRKLGYHWQREGSWLFSQRVLPDPTSFHVVDQYADVARALGAQCDRAEFDFHPFPEDVEAVREKLLALGRNEAQPLVVCHAGAGWESKRWPAAHFAALSRALNEKGAQVAFLGTKADEAALAQVRASDPGPILDMLGRTTVRELAALLSLAAIHAAGDTGSIHAAAALGRPCIGLYTFTRAERSCPYGQIQNCRTTEPNAVIELACSLLEKSTR